MVLTHVLFYEWKFVKSAVKRAFPRYSDWQKNLLSVLLQKAAIPDIIFGCPRVGDFGPKITPEKLNRSFYYICENIFA